MPPLTLFKGLRFTPTETGTDVFRHGRKVAAVSGGRLICDGQPIAIVQGVEDAALAVNRHFGWDNWPN